MNTTTTTIELHPPAPEVTTVTDDDPITALFNRLCQAWTDGDAAAYGSCFTADCDYVSFDGYHERGREPIVASHDKLFRGVLYGSALVGDVESIRHLRDGVAIVHGTGSVLVAWRRHLPRRRRTRNTMVAVRGGDGWQFTAMHNGRIRPVGVPEPDSAPARIARTLVRTSRQIGLGRGGPAAYRPR